MSPATHAGDGKEPQRDDTTEVNFNVNNKNSN